MSTDTTPRNSSVFGTEDLDSPFLAPLSVEPEPKAFSLRPTLQSKSATLSDRLGAAAEAAKAWLVPPNVLTEPAPALVEMSAYARRGAWTSGDGLLRKLGVLWMLLVAVPTAFVLRLKEWMVQRPSRAIFFVLIWQLAIRSDQGAWIADHIIRPYFHALAWIFLP